MSQLCIENISAAYGKKEVLKGISLSVKPGEIVALIGPNGAGKSTLLKVIAGFLKPSQGRVLFDGKEITPLAVHERVGQGIAYFMQGGKVFPNLTVAENLEMGNSFLSTLDKKENITAILEIFSNLKDLFNRRAGLLSGGERQALALAILLVKRPNLLLADEPSVGLSPKLMHQLFEKIYKLNSVWDTTILLVEQNIQEVLKIGHRAIALVEGAIEADTNKPTSWLCENVLENLFFRNTRKITKILIEEITL